MSPILSQTLQPLPLIPLLPACVIQAVTCQNVPSPIALSALILERYSPYAWEWLGMTCPVQCLGPFKLISRIQAPLGRRGLVLCKTPRTRTTHTAATLTTPFSPLTKPSLSISVLTISSFSPTTGSHLSTSLCSLGTVRWGLSCPRLRVNVCVTLSSAEPTYTALQSEHTPACKHLDRLLGGSL